nr:EamA family transporter [uncultured Clostridium sp.]
MSKIKLLCLLNTLMMVFGQLLFKIGSKGKRLDSLKEIILTMLNPVILSALCLYAATTVLWLYILSRTKISEAYPIQALAFPLVLIASSVLFKETVPCNRWIGVFIIFMGVYISVYK